MLSIPSRRDHLEALLAGLRSPGPAIHRVETPHDVGTAGLLPEAGPSEPDTPLRLRWDALGAGWGLESRLLADAVEEAVSRSSGSNGAPGAPPAPGARGSGPFAPLASVLSARRPVQLILGHADRLIADPEARGALVALWRHARSGALPLHLVLHRGAEGPASADLPVEFEGADPLRYRLLPPTLVELGGTLGGWPADRIVTARAVLGPSHGTWRRVDPGVGLSTNLVRLLLDPGAPEFDLGWRRLVGRVQKPERYAGILAAMAGGACEWGEIVARCPDFGSSSQLGPYMRTLEAEGLVRAERSLDAGPRSRRTRYRIVDGLVAFWYRLVLPVRSRLLAGEPPRTVWRDAIRPRVRDFVADRLPGLLRQELARSEVLGVRARETGGLWGDGYELPVCGILGTGAVFYGTGWWAAPPPHGTLERMREEIRETRWGFGRETRLRLLFVRDDPGHAWERAVARTPDSRFLGPKELVGRSGG